MGKSYVKWGLVLGALTLVFDLHACSPSGIAEDTVVQEDTVTPVMDEENAGLSGEYIITNDNESGVLKIFGPTPSGEIAFSLVMTTDSGCSIGHTGRAQLVDKNKAVFYQVNTNCSLEFNFSGGEVQVVQNTCPERDTVPCRFEGKYILSMNSED
jgi:hypothetical protein